MEVIPSVTAYEFIVVAKRWMLFSDEELKFEFTNRLFKVIGAKINHKKMTVRLVYSDDFLGEKNEPVKTFGEFQEAIHSNKAYQYDMIGKFDEMNKIFNQYKFLINNRHVNKWK